MPSYRDVKAQIAKLEKQAEDLFKKEVATVVTKIQGLMQEYGLTPDDIAGRVKAFKDYKAPKAIRKVKSGKPAGIPKYSDPVSGKTWTGHGKAPAWIAAAVKAGKKEDYLIGKTSKPAKPSNVAPKPATKVAKKPAPKTVATKAAPAKLAVKKPVAKKATPKKPIAKAAPTTPATAI